jgi:hypothetical protein
MTELDALLEKACRLGFQVQMFRVDRHGSEVLAAVYRWRSCADVLVSVDDRRAHAYRTPTGKDTDVFAPDYVCWWYRGNAVWTLRALLTLPDPRHPGAPGTLVPAPPEAGVSVERVAVRTRPREPLVPLAGAQAWA